MIDTRQNLQLRYDTFINREYSLNFFNGLGDYLDYVMSIPRLADVFKKQLDIREMEYKKVVQFENDAIVELKDSKNKLLKIIQKRRIDPKTLNQDLSFIPTSHLGPGLNILEHLEMFESGKVSVSGFHSDNLERYLFDIAANILRLGYQDDLKDFIVSSTQYGKYYNIINGPDTIMYHGGNIRGNFTFSKSWPKRFEQQRAISMARELQPWGAFEKLLKFWKSRMQISKNQSMYQTMLDVLDDKQYHFDNKDAADVAFAVEDFKLVQKNPDVSERKIHFLHLEQFRTKTATVHWQLSQAAEKQEESQSEQKPKIFAKEDQKNSILGIKGEKWWKESDRPTFDKDTGMIILGERVCKIPLGALNQIVLCTSVFSVQFGMWVQEASFINDFYKGEEGPRSLSDAIRAVNKRIKNDFGIEKMLEWGGRSRKVRIRSEVFEKV